MSRAPYRKPERPSEPRPRGVKVRMPDPEGAPEPLPNGRDVIRRLAKAEEARLARVAQLSPRVRLVGVAVLAIGLLLSWLTMGDIEAGIRSHPVRVLTFSSVAMFAGAWLMAVGMGGGDPEHDERPAKWVQIGLGVAVVIGAVWGASVHLDFLAWLALG